MRRVRRDQCQFGMTSVDDAVNVGPARKATGFMTNDEHNAEVLDRQTLFWWARSPSVVERQNLPRLVAAILRALRGRTRAAGCGEAQRTDGMRRSADDRSTGSWTDSGGAGAAVAP